MNDKEIAALADRFAQVALFFSAEVLCQRHEFGEEFLDAQRPAVVGLDHLLEPVQEGCGAPRPSAR